MMREPELDVVYVRTDSLIEYESNANTHTPEQVDQIASSISEFGFSSPILAWHDDDGNPVVVAGHGRLMAARKLGLEDLPVVFVDHMSDEQRRAFGLVENQLTRLSEFDWDISVECLEEKAPSYCFEVPSHNLVLRHNKCVFVTGNCGKDLSKADVSVNIACHLLAQTHGKTCTASCAIGDEEITFRFEDEDMTITERYENVVEIARSYVNDLGGFERLAEWGLI